jgi:hypothetical protein
VCIAVLLIGVHGLAQAGVYDVDDTDPASRIELKNKFYFTRSSEERSWRLPGISIDGPLGENLEWSIGSGYGMKRIGDGPTRSGLRDLSASVKWRLLDHSAEGGISMSIEPLLSFPVGNESAGIGSGAYGLECPLVIEKSFGRLQLDAQLRVERQFGRDEDEVGVGVLAKYALAERWSMGVELVAEAPSQFPGTRNLFGDVGLKWEPNDHFEVQMLAGHGLSTHDGSPESRARLVLEFKL